MCRDKLFVFGVIVGIVIGYILFVKFNAYEVAFVDASKIKRE